MSKPLFSKIGSLRPPRFRFGLISALALALALVLPLFTQQSFAQTAQTAQIAWNQDSGAAGYMVYYGLSSGDYTGSVNVGNTTSYALQNLSAQTYYLNVTAYDSNNNQSTDCPELVIDSLSASAGSGGSISPSGSFFQTQGASQTFTITPASGYQVANVLVDGVSAGAVTSYTLSNISASHTISATFASAQTTAYAITASAGPGGSISPSGFVSVNSGASQTFTIAANTGYQISTVTVDGSSLGAVSSYTFSDVTAAHTISATFASAQTTTYTITASAGSGGSISPSGSVSVNSGAGQTFTMTPASGYQVANVLVDGVPVGGVTGYTFSNISANHSFEAVFVSSRNNKLLWTGEGSAIIWTLDSSDNCVGFIGFGPYSGWTPVSYTHGTNGTSKLLWSGTGGYVSIWTLDISDNYVSSKVYGPYSGWLPVSYTFAPDGTARLLWAKDGGYVSIWTLDSSDNYVSSVCFGPYSGWTPLSYVFAPDGSARLLWSDTNGAAINWTLDSSNNYVSSVDFGPYPGWTPVSYVFAPDGTARLLWSNTSGAATIWTLDNSGNSSTSVGFGPYSGWMPIGYGFAVNGAPKLLWANTDGAANVWTLDSSDNYAGAIDFGPYSGYMPLSYK